MQFAAERRGSAVTDRYAFKMLYREPSRSLHPADITVSFHLAAVCILFSSLSVSRGKEIENEKGRGEKERRIGHLNATITHVARPGKGLIRGN